MSVSNDYLNITQIIVAYNVQVEEFAYLQSSTVSQDLGSQQSVLCSQEAACMEYAQTS